MVMVAVFPFVVVMRLLHLPGAVVVVRRQIVR